MVMEPEILKTLGGPRAFGGRRRIDLLTEVEEGLPTAAYRALAETLHLEPAEENILLRVSARTRARWKDKVRLDPATSDRVVRIARVLALATEVLENRENAVEWLREPSEYLGGRTPLEAIATDPCAEIVTNMLYQMEY
jgi:putative toxin-antitoxin system antitoxin component (TIGR02293 family)